MYRLFEKSRNYLRLPGKLAGFIGEYFWCPANQRSVNLISLLCELLVAIIIFMDLRFPEEIAIFFGIDILQDYEDYYADPVELGLAPPEVFAGSSTEYGACQIERRPYQEVYTLRKRTMSSRFQRASARRPVPTPRENRRMVKGQTMRASELPIYENLNLMKFDAIEEEESKSGSSEKIQLRNMHNSNN